MSLENSRNKNFMGLPQVKIPVTEIFPKPKGIEDEDFSPEDLSTERESLRGGIFTKQEVENVVAGDEYSVYEPSNLKELNPTQQFLALRIVSAFRQWAKENPHLRGHFNSYDKVDEIYFTAMENIGKELFSGRPIDKTMAQNLQPEVLKDFIKNTVIKIKNSHRSESRDGQV